MAIDTEVPMFGIWSLGQIGREHVHQFLGGGNDGNVVPRLSDSADGVDNRPRW